MIEFRVTYKFGPSYDYQTRVVTVQNANELSGALGHPWAIRSISKRCDHVKPNGERCARWTTDDYCHQHGKRH